MTERTFAAVDLGATSGRVVVGVVAPDDVAGAAITLHEVHRFATGVHLDDGHLRWRMRTLFEEILIGLHRAFDRFPNVESIGIDTWAVDYGLIDSTGELLADPISYRDERTTAVVDDLHGRIDARELYAVTGLQFLPFNTIYQLEAERRGPHWPQVASVVMLPDLIAYWLTGELATEATNASTTGLVDSVTGDWSPVLLGRLGLEASLLPPIQQPGTPRGTVLPALSVRLGSASATVVTSVGSHDTASAVVAIPATDRDVAFISSGTWSLVGLELEAPVRSEAARVANFSNEAGVDGRTRFLRNVGGLWLLDESIRTWNVDGLALTLDGLLGAAASLPTGGPIIDVDSSAFIPPGNMPTRIQTAAGSRADELVSPESIVRCILDSLAAAYATTIDVATRLTGRSADVIHIVGGGSQNALLCQLTADRAKRPVVAGPVEATALGNIAVQARSRGALPSTLEEIRSILARDPSLRHYTPR